MDNFDSLFEYFSKNTNKIYTEKKLKFIKHYLNVCEYASNSFCINISRFEDFNFIKKNTLTGYKKLILKRYNLIKNKDYIVKKYKSSKKETIYLKSNSYKFVLIKLIKQENNKFSNIIILLDDVYKNYIHDKIKFLENYNKKIEIKPVIDEYIIPKKESTLEDPVNECIKNLDDGNLNYIIL